MLTCHCTQTGQSYGFFRLVSSALAPHIQMKPNSKWIEEWQIGEKPSIEKEIAKDLLHIFVDFWDKQNLDKKSKTTRNRYSSSLHALGGYLVEHAISEDDTDKSAHDRVFAASLQNLKKVCSGGFFGGGQV